MRRLENYMQMLVALLCFSLVASLCPSPVYMLAHAGAADHLQVCAYQGYQVLAHPTEPSSFRLISAFTSSANSSGSLLKTSAQKPDMMVATASSGSMPRCWK